MAHSPQKAHLNVLLDHVDTNFAKHSKYTRCLKWTYMLKSPLELTVVSTVQEAHCAPWLKLNEKMGPEKCIAGQRLSNSARKYDTIFLHPHLKIMSSYTAGNVAFIAFPAGQSLGNGPSCLFAWRCTNKLTGGENWKHELSGQEAVWGNGETHEAKKHRQQSA